MDLLFNIEYDELLDTNNYAEFINNCNVPECKNLVLQYIENQTDKICLEAVKQNVHALQYVKNQTDEIYLKAIKQNILAFQYIEHPSLFLLLQIAKTIPEARKYIDKNRLINMKEKYKYYQITVIQQIISHLNQIYYKPNNIGALLCQQSFEKNMNLSINKSNKMIFLTQKLI